MINSYHIRGLILVLLLLLSGFFSASETALMALSKIRIRHMLEEKIDKAELIHYLTERPGKLLSSILIGNNAVNIGASALATSIAIDYYGNEGVAIATAIMTVLVLIFAEITPKSIAAKKAERVSLSIIRPLSLIITLLNPIVIVFTYITSAILKIFGVRLDVEKPFITEDELKTIVNVSHEEGVLEVDEKQMIHNVFGFGDMSIRDVMVQRTDITAFEINTPYHEIITDFKEEQFSRYPIYDDSIDNIVGILYMKDLFFAEGVDGEFHIKNYMRKPYYTFEFKKIREVFKEMKKNRNHIAVVLDEYGGTAGIVTMEDMLEEIVGEIQDEYDENEFEIEIINDNEFIVEGSIKLSMVNDLLNLKLESEEFDSIGGFIIGELGRLPKAGEILKVHGLTFKIEKLDRNRVKRIRILKNYEKG
ncbi:HlyC/CorC family transporter [Alkaliphilus serpentinus]|uniref:HlyC/CorC family transporter n=1 Tax=Alkaliphilus serpentinus TaxID=1482731 RepID=UPI002ED608F6